MTDEARITTSELAALLNHKSTAATRSWIRNYGLEPVGIDLETRENQYSRPAVEKAIASMPRGPYEKARPTDEEPPRHGPVQPDSS